MLQATSSAVNPSSALVDLWLQDWGLGRASKGASWALRGRGSGCVGWEFNVLSLSLIKQVSILAQTTCSPGSGRLVFGSLVLDVDAISFHVGHWVLVLEGLR